MGQKNQSDRIPPCGVPRLDLEVVRQQQNFADKLNEDYKVRTFLLKKLKNANVSKVTIERPAKNARITIHSARPGVVIGKKGEDIEALRAQLRKMMNCEIALNIEEVRKPEIDAQLIGDFDRPAARKAHHVPSRHEACDAKRHASRRPGHQDHELRPSERC